MSDIDKIDINLIMDMVEDIDNQIMDLYEVDLSIPKNLDDEIKAMIREVS